MIYETYCCALIGTQVEYGFTFKESAETDDTLFDLVIDTVEAKVYVQECDRRWEELAWAAKAICAAAPVTNGDTS